ncbi:MAG: outer membrane beta-barrel protein [Bacteroidales bacterium]|nr:outer membrane beta-barrel protein [Bacteroidales bacterium]
MQNLNLLTKSFLLAFLLFALNSNLRAQSNKDEIYKNAINFGLYHSFNLTTVVGDFPDIETLNIRQETKLSSPRFTFDIGMTMDYHINKLISMQFDALFTYNGGHFASTRTIYNEVGKVEQNEWFTLSTSYFQFPISMVVYPQEQLYFSAGAYIATLVHSQRYHYWYESNTSAIKDINNFDYGLVFGMGFNMSFVKVGFQYSYGLSDMIHSSDYNLHHSDYKLVVRWKFSSDIRDRKRGY